MDPRNEMQTECEDNETVIDPSRHFSFLLDFSAPTRPATATRLRRAFASCPHAYCRSACRYYAVPQRPGAQECHGDSRGCVCARVILGAPG